MDERTQLYDRICDALCVFEADEIPHETTAWELYYTLVAVQAAWKTVLSAQAKEV